MTTDYITKTCTKCGNTYPATKEYFCRDRRQKEGLHSWCKICNAKHGREYKRTNKNKITEQRRVYRQASKDKIVVYQREYAQTNKNKRAEYDRAYRQANKDKIAEKTRKYKQANPDKIRVKALRYRARKLSLPDTFTHGQWLNCLEYFNYSCAVCGIEFRDNSPHADHWIPLASDDCIGTVATNMVCLCSTCNTSKNSTMPDVWLKDRRGEYEANEILNRIITYFEWVQMNNVL